jgi:MFS family permease
MSEELHPNAAPPEGNPSPAPGGWLNRNVLGMGLTSLLSDAGHEMATAVLAGFLAVIGAPAYALGVIEGVADALSSFVKLGTGWWSDRLGHRKGIVTAGYALTGCAKALFALAAGWPLVLVGRVLAWFGRGIRGPLRDAMLAESVTAKDRGKAFGFHRAGDTLGAIIGPLLGAWLLVLLLPYATPDPSTPFRMIFLLTLVPGLASVVAFMLLVREERRPPNHEAQFWASVRALPSSFRRFLVGVGVFGAGDFSHTLLILAATQLLTPTYGPVEAAQAGAVLYALRNVLYAAASYPVGAMSDRTGRRGLLAAGYALAALVMVGFAAVFFWSVTSLFVLGVLFALAGVYIAVEDALEGALTADLVPDLTNRGTAYGVMGTVNGVGDLVSSVVVGVLWSVNPVLGFVYAALMMLAGWLLLYRVR